MRIWNPDELAVAYDARLLDWQLGYGHPTNPIRAKLCVEKLQALGVPAIVEPISWRFTDELEVLHTSEYVQRTLVGHNAEWSGVRPDLGAVVAHVFAGTVQLTHGIDRGDVNVGVSPQGAKHHAMDDHSAGFCVCSTTWRGLRTTSPIRASASSTSTSTPIAETGWRR